MDPARSAQCRSIDGRGRGLPVLEQHHRAFATAFGFRGEVREVRRERPREVVVLAILAVVDVLRVMRADPLSPSLKDETRITDLDVRRGRIADEHVPDVIPARDEGRGEVVHARGEAADERVAVGSLERDEDDVPHECR